MAIRPNTISRTAHTTIGSGDMPVTDNLPVPVPDAEPVPDPEADALAEPARA